jgi:hypothetical protein
VWGRSEAEARIKGCGPEKKLRLVPVNAGNPTMLEALQVIAGIAEGSTTANSLPNIARIARAAIEAAEGRK